LVAVHDMGIDLLNPHHRAPISLPRERGALNRGAYSIWSAGLPLQGAERARTATTTRRAPSGRGASGPRRGTSTSVPEAVPQLPEILAAGHDLARADDLDAGTPHEVFGMVGRGQLHGERDGASQLPGGGPITGAEGLAHARFNEVAGLGVTERLCRVAIQPFLDGRRDNLGAEEFGHLAAGRDVASDEDDWHVPDAADRRFDSALAHERLVDPGVVPGLTAHRVAHDTVGRAGHRVRANEQCGIASLSQRLDIAAPGVAKHIAGTGLKPLGNQTLEAVGAAGTVTVDDDDLVGSGSPRPAHRRVDLASHQAAPLLILGRAAIHLAPDLDARDPFHIDPDDDAHDDVPPCSKGASCVGW